MSMRVGVIEVWMATTEAAGTPGPRTDACSPEERQRAARFGVRESGARWLAARGALRVVLANRTGRAPADIVFTDEPGGKPLLREPPGLHFSLSHSGSAVAVAVADRPVGIDIEGPRRLHSPARLADRVFSAEDRAAWEGLPELQRNRRLLQHWTRTEALLKATGEGLAGGTRGTVERLSAVGWTVEDLAIPPLFGAVAARGSDWSVDGPTWLDSDPRVLDADAVVGLLAEPTRLRVVAALALGSRTVAEVATAARVPPASARRALQRLAANGLVAIEPGATYRLLDGNLRATARATADAKRSNPSEQSDVLRNFVRGGRLVSIPAARAKRLVVLDFLAARFDPGRTYPERDVNVILGEVHPDFAALRRYLVDEGFLERRDGFYWRAGGTFDVDGDP